MSSASKKNVYRRNNIMIFLVIILGCLGTIAGNYFLNKKSKNPFSLGIEQFLSPQLSKIKNENCVLIVDRNSFLSNKTFSYDLLKDKLSISSVIIPPEPDFYYSLKQQYPELKIHYLRSNTNYSEIFNENIDYILYDVQHIGIRDEQLNTLIFNIMSVINRRVTELIILDRPNPFGHSFIQGFQVNPKDITETKIINVPLFHGLSTAELAREIARTHYFSDINLSYVIMDNVQRFRVFDKNDFYANLIGPEKMRLNDKFSRIFFQYMNIFKNQLFVDEESTIIAHEKINAFKLSEAVNAFGIEGLKTEATGIYDYNQKLIYGLRINFSDEFKDFFQFIFQFSQLLVNNNIIQLNETTIKDINNFIGSSKFTEHLNASKEWSSLSKILKAERESYYDYRLAILLY